MAKQIPIEIYKKIHQLMPITCVDVVIKHNNKFLLGLRINKPEKGAWWLPGGRVLKGETLEHAVTRKTKEETGLNINIIKCLGTESAMFPDGPFGHPTHTIGTTFLVKPISSIEKIKKDSQTEQFQWFEKIDKTWHPYVKKFLHLAGFK